MKRQTAIFLFLIVSLAAVLRLYQLGQNPPSLTWDEASLGYNAWSIALTGRDEHGKVFPRDAFAAFGDYKPPAYIYAAVPFVRILGPTPAAVRLPSALAGIGAVFLTYFLSRALFAQAGKNRPGNVEHPALVAAFLLAVSPWHLQLSRAAIEANLATTWIIAGATFLVLSRQRPKLLPAAAVFWALGFYTFNSSRVFVPLLVLGAGVLFAKDWLKNWRWTLLALATGGLILLPLIPFLRSPLASLRFHEVNIFADFKIVQTANLRLDQDHWAWWARIVHNRRLGYALSFLDHYFDHFSGEFLFGRGDNNPKLSTGKMGELYLAELPFLLLGLVWLLRHRSAAGWFILFWMVAAPIPAATARETPHALRALTFLPSFQIITALGLTRVWPRARKLMAVAAVLLLIQFSLYLNYYYQDYPKEFSADWLYGYQPMVDKVLKLEKNYDRILVTEAYGRPYIFFLWYGRLKPEFFWEQGQVNTDVFGLKNVPRLGKFEFRRLDFSRDFQPGTLLVGTPADFPDQVKPIEVIRFLNGEKAFVIAGTEMSRFAAAPVLK